jgi:biotin transport system substrate-specific component
VIITTMNEAIARIQSWSRMEKLLLKSFAAALFAFLTFLAAEIRIPLPFTPIPMTLQTFIAPLAGGFLGAIWGAGSMLLYMVLGIAGLNVFAAASGGVGFFLAPSAGYVFGFVIAAFILGFVQARTTKNSYMLGGLILSHLAIFACGVAGLMWNAQMTAAEAFAKGVAPFLIGDVFKISASFIVLASYNRMRRN